MRKILWALKASGLRCNLKKCKFGYEHVKFLGHEVSRAGVYCETDKVEAVVRMKAPVNVSELRCFMGLWAYYQNFLLNYSAVTEPLRNLLKKDTRWHWGPDQQATFETVKAMLTSAEFLATPDYARPFVIQTDWCRAGLSAILSQPDAQGQERVVEFASRACTPAEPEYGSYRGEMLAVVWATNRLLFRVPDSIMLLPLTIAHASSASAMTSPLVCGSKNVRWISGNRSNRMPAARATWFRAHADRIRIRSPSRSKASSRC